MADTVEHGGLKIDQALYDFINNEVMPETGVCLLYTSPSPRDRG